MARYALPRRTSGRSRELRVAESPGLSAHLGAAGHHYLWEERQAVPSYVGMLAALGYNGVVGYRIMAAYGEVDVNLTDSEWRALVYVASQHGFSAPHLRLEEGEEAVDVQAVDAEGLRSALGRALEARDVERIRTPDGELAYDTIQRVRHVLLSDAARLSRTSA